MSYYDALLHVDSADPAILRLVFRNAANYLNALPEGTFNLAVVANAAAVDLFTNTHEDLRELAQPLMAKNVKIKICNNALKERGVNPADIWQGCEIVPAGVVEIVKLQREGFAYIKP